MFDITEGVLAGGKLEFSKHGIVLSKRKKRITLSWKEIDEVSLVDSQMLDKSDSVTFGTIGALFGGPVGAAVGAGIGAVSRPCTFHVRAGERKLIAKGWRALFDKMSKEYQTRSLMDH